jgi:hypothetical protein
MEHPSLATMLNRNCGAQMQIIAMVYPYYLLLVSACRWLYVSANVVNHPLLSWVHSHLYPLVNYVEAGEGRPWVPATDGVPYVFDKVRASRRWRVSHGGILGPVCCVWATEGRGSPQGIQGQQRHA